ncbi:MAG: 3-keto-disaccharide hydrolase [Nitrososphaeraceae archaeon]
MRAIEKLTDTVSVLLLAVIVFMSLISVSTIISEQQKTDTTEMLTDRDYSTNNMNEQKNNKNLVMAEPSAASNINFTSIFDSKNLNGWKMAGEGKFVIVESDAALQSEGGMGLLWYTENKYKNFILRLEWKVSDEGDNSGVFVRFPDPDGNPNNAVREGYEIQIDDKATDSIHQTGAIYDFAAPNKIVSKPPGQWNAIEIQVINQSYTVIMNGQKVTEFTGNRLTEGYVGLQAHDDKSKVSFRNIMIKVIKS